MHAEMSVELAGLPPVFVGHAVQGAALLLSLFQKFASHAQAEAAVDPEGLVPMPHGVHAVVLLAVSFHVLAGHGNVLEMHVDVVGSHIFPVAQSVGPKGQSEAALSPEAIVVVTQQQART